jgi:hypothetical protein
MKRFFALLFLFLYLYNIVGYLAIFSVMQLRIRSEVKKMLKANLPESKLTTFAFCTVGLENDEYPIQWIEDHEFRYDGSLYDIARSYSRGDTTYFVCINDKQEDQLFAHLDNHVQRHMEDSGKPSKLDSFKDVFKDSFARSLAAVGIFSYEGIIAASPLRCYLPVELDVLVQPPRMLNV